MKRKEHAGLEVLTAVATNMIKYRPFWKKFTDVSDERSTSIFREK
jgi:hypothetical protein